LVNILNLRFTSRAGKRLSDILDESYSVHFRLLFVIEIRSQEKVDKAPTALSSDTESKKVLVVKRAAK